MEIPGLMSEVQATGGGGFSIGTLLLFVGGAILLAFFCSLGLIARMREHRIEERKEQERKQTTAKAAGDRTGDP